MKSIRSVVRQHPFAAFVALAYVLLLFSIPIAFTAPNVLPLVLSAWPPLAAIALTALGEGRAGLKALFARMVHWRVQPRWYVAAIGIPVVGTLMMVAGAMLAGSETATNFGGLPVVLFLLSFIFNGLEELGWRAYALPKLLAKHTPLAAGVVVGGFWAVFHLQLHLPGNWNAQLPVLPSIIILIAYSLLITWIFINTRYSALLTTLFHGTLNTLTPLTAGIEPVQAWWLRATVFGGLAVLMVVLAGRSFHQTVQPASGTTESLSKP